MRIRHMAGSLFFFLAVSASWADPLGTAFTYQGRLKSAGSLANGSFNMDFKLYPVPAGGTLLASQTLPGVSVSDGLFTVQVDFGAGVFDGNQRWLDVTVNGTPLVPRQELTATPYALFASNADRLDGLNSTAFLQSVPVPLTLSGTSATHIIRGENTLASNGATGVYGLASGASGQTFGGYFQSNSTSGIGVYGRANAGTGVAYGVWGQSSSTDGYGVVGNGLSLIGASNGGLFVSFSTSGRGVSGMASAATGITYGVYGQSVSTSGRGVFGEATALTGTTFGGRFETDSTTGRGVFGYASATSGTPYGVLGQASTASAGYAVYATGDSGASGTKAFRMDHPDDPANKYLLHYAAESPEVINFYSEIATLDDRGEAVVELPHYFAKINTRPRYQLTAVGAPMPMLHVARKISDAALSVGAKAAPDEVAPVCAFRIAGGSPGGEVSWRVEAVRNDRWVQQRGAPVEVEKQGNEKGTYQHPELYGQPPEKGMNYESTRQRHDLERPSPPFRRSSVRQSRRRL